ncbi:hypothetical protein T4E_8108 [Trichinella pseudospiralis]|uniref:Uncharacterized protein n=1 Tax=Trichinella pseudospiralis TaxID=6337 RepID=A0A0V0YKH0_TRIPS|nr:hypothetical protein T4E_8108 [Trichinella pseudospiralis]
MAVPAPPDCPAMEKMDARVHHNPAHPWEMAQHTARAKSRTVGTNLMQHGSDFPSERSLRSNQVKMALSTGQGTIARSARSPGGTIQ